jgi:flagellar motor switch protein FliG
LIFKSLGFSLSDIALIIKESKTKNIEKLFDDKLNSLEGNIFELIQYKDMILAAKNFITQQGLEEFDKERLVKDLVSMKNIFIGKFSTLNEELQLKILLEIYRTGSLSVDTIRQMGGSDSTQLISELHMMTIKAVMSKLDGSTEKNLMLRLEKDKPEFADRLKISMFNFEDIIMLPDTTIKKWLEKCDDERLAMSLSSSGKVTQKRIYNNLSRERREKIINTEKSYSLEETYEAMTDLVEVLKKMDMSGEIEIDRD